MTEVDRLLETLRRDFGRFSPAQQSLARFLADHVAELPLLSAQEVAAAAHCSPATVVRFAQSLGFPGYPAVQRAVRQAQRQGSGAWRAPVTGSDPFARAMAADRAALDDVADRLAGQGLTPLVAALSGRTPLLLAGEGLARPVISLIEERLARAGRGILVVEGLTNRDRARVAALPRSGAVLAVAVGRETAVAEAAVSVATSAGLPAVVLVDSALSPLARMSLCRVVPADERGGLPGLVALIAVAQNLASGLVAADRSEIASKRDERLTRAAS